MSTETGRATGCNRLTATKIFTPSSMTLMSVSSNPIVTGPGGTTKLISYMMETWHKPIFLFKNKIVTIYNNGKFTCKL